MYAAALIPYVAAEHDFTLEELRDHLAEHLDAECTLVDSEETDGPEVRVATSMPIAIRIEDNAEVVYDDLGYLAEDAEGVLPPEWIEVLMRCTARLEVLDADFEWPEPDANGAFELPTGSDLDPRLPDVEAAIVEVARFLDSFAYDNVNDEWLVPAP